MKQASSSAFALCKVIEGEADSCIHCVTLCCTGEFTFSVTCY